MFVIRFPVTFKIGDTIDCDINSVPATVTYKDKGTLVIGPSEVGLRENERAVESCRNSGNFTEAQLTRVQKCLHDGSRDFREIQPIEPVADLNRFVCADAVEVQLEPEITKIEKEEVKS